MLFLFFLNPKFQTSYHLLWLCSPVCVGPGQKPRRLLLIFVLFHFSRGSIHFGPEVYSSQSLDNLPFVEIGSLSDEIFASYSGPDDGLAYGIDERENGNYCKSPKFLDSQNVCIICCVQYFKQNSLTNDNCS